MRLVSPSSRPLAVGIFGALDTAHSVVPVPGGSAAYRFMLWKVRWDTVKQPIPSPPAAVRGRDSILVVLSEKRFSGQPGAFDQALPPGDWYVDGWNAAVADTMGLYDWTYPPATRWMDSTILGACFKAIPTGTLIGNCHDLAAPSPWNKESDAHFVVRVR